MQIEYAEESIENISILVKSLVRLLLERELIQREYLDGMLKKVFDLPADNKALSIASCCPTCGRKNMIRIGDTRKCNYCNTIISVDLAASVASNDFHAEDAGKLFSCQVQATDISDSIANSEKPLPDLISNNYWWDSVVTKSFLGNDFNGIRRISEDPAYKDIAQDIIDGSRKDRQSLAYEEALRVIKSHQNPVTRLCQVMEAILQGISKRSPETKEKFLSEYLLIDSNKRLKKYDSLYSPVSCPKCGVGQVRSNLFTSTCHSCSENLTLELLPGLLVFKSNDTDPSVPFSPRMRKLEHLYTLFEALFSCAISAYDITYNDLSLETSMMCRHDKTEESDQTCPFCHRPIRRIVFSKAKCMYCDKTQSADLLDQYL